MKLFIFEDLNDSVKKTKDGDFEYSEPKNYGIGFSGPVLVGRPAGTECGGSCGCS